MQRGQSLETFIFGPGDRLGITPPPGFLEFRAIFPERFFSAVFYRALPGRENKFLTLVFTMMVLFFFALLATSTARFDIYLIFTGIIL